MKPDLFPNVKKHRGARVSHQTCEKICKEKSVLNIMHLAIVWLDLLSFS